MSRCSHRVFFSLARLLAPLVASAALALAALALAPPALAVSGSFGTSGQSDTGGMGCAVGSDCIAFAYNGAEATAPVTGEITSVTLTHGLEGTGQTATILVVNDDGSRTVTASSVALALSNINSTETFDLTATPVAISLGQTIAIEVTPGSSSQSADNVAYNTGTLNGDLDICPGSASVSTIPTTCDYTATGEALDVSAYVQDAQAPPSVDSYSAPTQVTATSATLHAQINPDGQSTTGWFIYGTSASNLDQTSSTVSLGNGSTDVALNVPISSLTPNTTYYYEAVATNYDASNNSGDQIAGTEQSNLVTPSAPPPGVGLASPPVTNVGEHGATLNGDVASNGFSTTWYFQYGTDTGYGSQSSGGTIGSGSGASPQAVSASISSLAPNTTYHYQLIAKNVGGQSTTQDGVFTTAKGQPPSIGSYAAAGAANGDPTIEMLSFAINGDGYSTTYHVDYGLTAGYGSSTAQAASQSAARSAGADGVTLTSLSPSSTYHYRVVAQNEWGTTYGPDQTFSTPAAPTPFLSGFKITYLDPAAIYGEFVENDRGWASVVSVQYGTSTSYGSSVPMFSTLGYAQNNVADFVIGNLAPGTIYHWRAVATNRWGTTYGPDETTITLSLDQLSKLLNLLGSSSPRQAPVVVINVIRPVVTLGQFSCPPACKVSVWFAIPGKGRHGKPQPLGHANFKVPAGKKLKLGVKLSKKADRLLRKRHRVRVIAKYKITDPRGNSTTIIRQLTLSGGKPHGRRR